MLNNIIKFRFFLAFFLIIFNLSSSHILAAGYSNLRIEILALCGNDIAEPGEDCDGLDLYGQSCSTLGYDEGTLSCEECSFITSECINNPNDNPGGGGGGGGGGGAGQHDEIGTTVIFMGKAYPRSTVTLLQDAQIVATTRAGLDASFSLTVSDIAGGTYIFSMYSEDSRGVRSSLFTFSIRVIPESSTQVSGIFIAPTIALDKIAVKKGETITIFGQSVPNGEITISVHSDEEFIETTQADQDGAYLHNFNTALLDNGEHFTKTEAEHEGEISPYSQALSFVVGDETVYAPTEQPGQKSDVNADGHINLVDFSVMAYWYKKSAVPSNVDLNADGKVDLIDFSILSFYWTG